jgi:hypothetical protein
LIKESTLCVVENELNWPKIGFSGGDGIVNFQVVLSGDNERIPSTRN